MVQGPTFTVWLSRGPANAEVLRKITDKSAIDVRMVRSFARSNFVAPAWLALSLCAAPFCRRPVNYIRSAVTFRLFSQSQIGPRQVFNFHFTGVIGFRLSFRTERSRP